MIRRGSVASREVEFAVTKAFSELGVDHKLGRVEVLADEIRGNQKSFEQMLVTPTGRGSFGELSLEVIMKDQLPKDMFGIRKQVIRGKTPDAHIDSTVGVICIDSKFPFANYRKIMETNDSVEKERLKKSFTGDVAGHLSKVAQDYVCPEYGSAEFAFVYIPSEAVYWFIVTECFDLLREFTIRGVQVVSPLTLSHKIELIKAGVHAKKLSEEAENVRNNMLKLDSHLNNIEELWSTLYETHLHRLKGKADDVETALKLLRAEFQRIKTFEA
jgi:DNA recombination protein RmuC